MKKHWRHLRASAALALAAVLGTAPLTARAADYPSRPITLIIPSVAGGILDSIGRFVSRGMATMGQPIVVQYTPGAGGSLGDAALVRAAPDGYTVGLVASSHAINPSLYSRLPFDTKRDFIDVSHVVDLTNVLVVHPSVPAKSLAEFIALAKKQPGALNCGSAGNGQSNHLSLEMFNAEAGVKLQHVPYKGSAAAFNDALAGTVSCMFVDMLTAKQHIASGSIRALAVTSAKRHPDLPNVPTFAELGMKDFSGSSWLAVVVRTGTPKDVVERINAVVGQVMKDPEVVRQLTSMGVVPVGASLADSQAFMEGEIARYGLAVKAAGLKVD
ncbi:tripartite tricarboxylate transporter substrate binding protein [Bordetella genomosp. 6]|uniref:tripartite tricarboxylate transporter substrate binding protein n=1 Tax=Bordetella genomosp. 6 TaxID=463024 RepID=UPI0012FCFF7D|nr:tripartite tricarboxylate transporter substrate binding protein [Bordetella genomosp. 6]